MAVNDRNAIGNDRSLCSGLRMIEIGESVSAAVSGMVFADYGADVLIIEPPNGSRLRQIPAFAMWSRGKRSIRLDLTTSTGRERVQELAADSDVMITALEPATADRFGVDGGTMCTENPRLVHCEVTGFGRDHPLRDVPGYEGVVSSAAGRAHEFAVLFGGERPAYPAVPVATHGAAMLALEGVFAALLEREHTGRGQRLETSLLRALSVFDLMRWAPGADRALRVADVPMLIYTVARTRDGVWLQFSQNGPGLFRAFLRALQLEHVLEQEQFRTAPHIVQRIAGHDCEPGVQEVVTLLVECSVVPGKGFDAFGDALIDPLRIAVVDDQGQRTGPEEVASDLHFREALPQFADRRRGRVGALSQSWGDGRR
jgi:crotonobetainyl-CoA:carnitine CoA-transferase CaiB-like acyl-CoA transferase